MDPTNLQTPPRFCPYCKTPITPGQTFCATCGTKVDVAPDLSAQAAIDQFNAGIKTKKKRSRLLPILLGSIALVAVIAGVLIYFFVSRSKSVEEYKNDANDFYLTVLSASADLEGIGNEIEDSWKAYVTSSYYRGSRYYSVDTAVDAAERYMSSEIAAARSDYYTIRDMYDDLGDPPNDDLSRLGRAVEELYDAYLDLYDCVIDPSGSYNSWTEEFSSTDNEAYNAIKDIQRYLD